MKKIYSSLLGNFIGKCRLLVVCGICLLFSFAASAQDGEKVEDPMKKPEVWEELKGHPDDSLMWSRYVSKPWACFSKKDRDNIDKWRKSLARALDEVVIETQTDHVNWEEEGQENAEANEAMAREHQRVDNEIQAYIARLEETLVEEQQEILDLKSNIQMNFFIIEELYQEQFSELGIPYKSYLDTYPKGDFNKAEWIEEKGKELHKIKSKNFQKTKKEILKDARKHQHGNVH